MSVNVPIDTVEKPLWLADYIAALQSCTSISEVSEFSAQVPEKLRNDDRYTKAVALKLASLHERKAAA